MTVRETDLDTETETESLCACVWVALHVRVCGAAGTYDPAAAAGGGPSDK